MSLQWEVWELEQYLSSSAVQAGIVQILLYNSIKMGSVWSIIFITIIKFFVMLHAVSDPFCFLNYIRWIRNQEFHYKLL